MIGFAFDGFAVYGPYEAEGVMAKDLTDERALDVCNGHRDGERGYHYHVTPGRFPYILGGYAGVVEPSNNRGLAHSGTGAIENNARPGDNRLEKIIADVRPGTGYRGGRRTVQVELLPEKARRDPLPAGPPSWVQIGPFEAQSVTREGNLVTVEINIPNDAPVGVLLDCHIEFEPVGGRGRALVFKKNDVFRVTDDALGENPR